MNGAMVGFLVAVGVTSTFIFALSKRMERRRAGWGSSRRPIGSADDGGLSSRSDSWSFASLFGSSKTFGPEHHSSGHHNDSCGAWDSGTSGDGGSGSDGADCGGGGGDGGGSPN